jgi:hypothetical protein
VGLASQPEAVSKRLSSADRFFFALMDEAISNKRRQDFDPEQRRATANRIRKNTHAPK